MLKRIFITLITLILLAGGADAFSLSIDPPHLDIEAVAGKTVSGTIRVDNLGEVPLQVEAFMEDWLYAPDGSKNFYPAGSTPRSCSQWIKLDPAEFSLPAKSYREVKYSLTVPKAADGGHYSVIFFKAGLGEGMYQGQMVALAGRIGSIVYQTTKGTEKPKGRIVNLGISKTENSDDIFIEITFKNEGNVHLTADGKVELVSRNGRVLDRVKVEELKTLPEETKVFKIKYAKTLPRGLYTLDAELNYGVEDKAVLNKVVMFRENKLAVMR